MKERQFFWWSRSCLLGAQDAMSLQEAVRLALAKNKSFQALFSYCFSSKASNLHRRAAWAGSYLFWCLAAVYGLLSSYVGNATAMVRAASPQLSSIRNR